MLPVATTFNTGSRWVEKGCAAEPTLAVGSELFVSSKDSLSCGVVAFIVEVSVGDSKHVVLSRAALQCIDHTKWKALVFELPEFQAPDVLVLTPVLLPTAHMKQLALIRSEVVHRQHVQEFPAGLHFLQKDNQTRGELGY